MNIHTTIRVSLTIAIAAAFSACGSSADNDNNIGSSDTSNVSVEKDTKAQNVFYSIPSPIETTSLLKGAGAKYNASYLNPIENLSKYSTAASRALNLGVYGTDLSFTSIFDQTQESMLYLRCTNKLATSLGISGAFDEATTARIEANLENRDSLLTIISDSYWNADTYLKENGQPGVSALIIAGGWIEGLYIATQIANATKNEDIATRIGEQKLSLDNLVALLDSYKTSNDGVNNVLTQLQELKTIYDGIQVKPSETKASTDQQAGVTTIENKSDFKITPEQLKAISDKSAQIRNKIIQ
ncbi:MAG: hypothetical protein K0Q95_1981 [Bacteroidota bacterium]|jgi:hypothetical protein|nr:hypothetical protein [Bacteroidota bacterium]